MRARNATVTEFGVRATCPLGSPCCSLHRPGHQRRGDAGLQAGDRRRRRAAHRDVREDADVHAVAPPRRKGSLYRGRVLMPGPGRTSVRCWAAKVDLSGSDRESCGWVRGEFFDFQRVFMIRPWKVVLGGSAGGCGVAGLRHGAGHGPADRHGHHARARARSTRRASRSPPSYACTDDVARRPSARARSPTARRISTATVGNFQFTVTGDGRAGGTTTVTRDYSVKARRPAPRRRAPGDAEPHAGHARPRSRRSSRVSARTTRRRSARRSSRPPRDATLSVADASATATGHLVNGAVRAGRSRCRRPAPAPTAETTPGAMGPVGGSATRLTLLTYGGPRPAPTWRR